MTNARAVIAAVNKTSTGVYEFFPASGLVDMPDGIHKLYAHPLQQQMEEAVGSAIRTALRSLGNPDLDEADIQKFAEDYVKRTYG